MKRMWLGAMMVASVMMTGCVEDGKEVGNAEPTAAENNVAVAAESDTEVVKTHLVSVTLPEEEPVDLRLVFTRAGVEVIPEGETATREARQAVGTLVSLKKGEQVEGQLVFSKRWRERRQARRLEEIRMVLKEMGITGPEGNGQGGVSYGGSFYFKGYAPGMNFMPSCMTMQPGMNPQPPNPLGTSFTSVPGTMPTGTTPAVAPSGSARPATPAVPRKADRGPAAKQGS